MKTAGSKKILILIHSRTGVSARVGREASGMLTRRGFETTLAPLKSRWRLPYLLWLLISFIPSARVPLREFQPDPAHFDGLLIVSPKWTFSNPILNSLLSGMGRRLPPTAMVVTCGGWDERRYLDGYLLKMKKEGIDVLGGETIRRRSVDAGRTVSLLRETLGSWFR